MTLSRKEILGHVDTRIGRVDVPEMGGDVCLASLTVAEADKIRTLGENDIPAVVGLVILGACDETGKRLFTLDDKDALAKLPASALGKIANAVLAHNGLAGDDEKNASSETETDVSDSASPLPSDAPSPSLKAA